MSLWSRAWTPVPSPEVGGAAVWAKVTAASGDSPLDPRKATCVLPGALTACLAQSRRSLEVGELMSCQGGDVARGTSHHPLEQHDQSFPPPRRRARARVPRRHLPLAPTEHANAARAAGTLVFNSLLFIHLNGRLWPVAAILDSADT